jgi:predicted RNase H-like nuclease
MRFLGIDLGWISQPSGLAALEWDGRALQIIALDRLDSFSEVRSWTMRHLSLGPAWLAMDAPVLIGNNNGMRRADKLMHSLFGRQKAGAYPVHRGMPFTAGILQLVDQFRALGFSTDSPLVAQPAPCHLFEVFPHAASLRLFDLPEILPYKKGSLARRRQALAEFRELLALRLSLRQPVLRSPVLPEIPSGGHALKAVEDQLDALLCAYIAAHVWYWGAARTNFIGDPVEGFILNPSF